MVTLSTNAMPTLFRRTWSGKYKLISTMLTSLTLVYITLFVIPVRNVILRSTVEYAWLELETTDLIRIHYGKGIFPEGVLADISCPAYNKPRVNINDILPSSILTYDHLRMPEVKKLALGKGHGRFLPALNQTQKIEVLYLYKVVSAALDSAGVKYFLVAGSLLGLNRHGGSVPWDDDLDISVSLDAWRPVKKALSCIDGFALNKLHPGHWKLHYNGRYYPFVDIFFYRMDESYVWAATSYTRKTYIYPTRFVFPLGESIFEGMKVPVPRDSLSIARRIYEYEMCVVHQGHMKGKTRTTEVYPDGYSITRVPCKDLSYMYKFF